MSKKLKRKLKRIIIALCSFIIVMAIDNILKIGFNADFPGGLASIIKNETIGWILSFLLYFIIYIYIGYDVLYKAIRNIKNGQIFDENFLMCIATIGAFGLGIHTSISSKGLSIEGFDEACAVLLFYQVGEWFQSYAVGKSRKSIASLMDIRPDFANVKLEDGTFQVVEPSSVQVGDIIQVKPGERIPLDGIVISGVSSLDTKALTGESLPQEVKEGSNVISGTINLTSTLQIKVLKAFYDSTVSKILDLVENASNQKSKSENFISRFAKYYTPIVVFSALAVAFIPTIIFGITNQSINGLSGWNTFSLWLKRALTFLVVSCPCALVISIPLSFFSGIGGASRNGFLVKGSVYLERFNQTNIFVFDKTGTLTKGNFEVIDVYPQVNKEEILKEASIAEFQSNHPIALSIKRAYGKRIDDEYTIEDIPGKGIKATKNDCILCGNEKLMKENNIDYVPYEGIGTNVYVAKNGKFLGYIVIADEIKEEAKDLISYLNSVGAKTIMLTGDNEKIASHVCKELAIKEYKASLLPQNKVEVVDELIKQKKEKEVLCFVGDGINDAPTLMRADIGIAMGGIGSDAAIEASDIVLMHDDLKCIKLAKRLARKTMIIVKENIWMALVIKIGILILSTIGLANMWIAVFGDVGVAVMAILNAMRANTKFDD